MLNNVHNPSERVILTLERIRGERVDRWALSKTSWLGTVSNDPALLNGQDVWSVFMKDFLREFAYPVERANARKEIEEIKMEGVELEAYIQSFRKLAHEAQYDLNTPYAIHLFLQGLPSDLVRCSFGRDELTTFDDWVDATRKYRIKYCLILNILCAPPLSNEEAVLLWQAEAMAARDSSTMDVEPPKRVLTEEDKSQYKREGRCFRCSQQGHISKMCPQKGETTTTRRSTMNERRETLSPLARAERLLLQIRALPIEGRRVCVESIRDDPGEFWNRNQTSSPTYQSRTGVIVVGDEV